MPTSIRNLSPTLLGIIEDCIKDHSDIIMLTQVGDYLTMVDRTKKSDYFFRIERDSISNGIHSIAVTHKPASLSDISAKQKIGKPESVRDNLLTWIISLEKFLSLTVFEESFEKIEQQYKDEFLNNFRIEDSDAKTNVFGWEQQMFLYQLLTHIASELKGKLGDDLTNQQKEEILESVIGLKTSLTTDTKEIFFNKLANFVSRVKRYSVQAGTFIILTMIRGPISEAGKSVYKTVKDTTPEIIELAHKITALPSGNSKAEEKHHQ